MAKSTTKKAIRARRTPKATTASIADIEDHVNALELRLNTLIVWMAQSAGSPISVREAEMLINEVGVV